MAKAPESFAAPNNTNPYLLPSPPDVWFYAGDKFVDRLGPAYDNEGNNVRVVTDFGMAERFIWWDKQTNTIVIPENATTSADVGQYPLTVSLYDDVKTAVPGGLETWIGNVTYNFKLTI